MTNVKTNNNPLLCDPVEGICGVPGATENVGSVQANEKLVKLVYFSDPVCSACWGLEPTLRKLQLEYGNSIEVEYHMGGLLPSWEAMGSRVDPSQLAQHSDNMSSQIQMPMNGEVWINDPPQSSYPPSIAFKAAQMQDKQKASLFLRKIREGLFVHSVNIARWEQIEKAAREAGLDITTLKKDIDGAANLAFEEDLKLAQKMGVRGFPCVFVTNEKGESETLYGLKPYSDYEKAISKSNPTASKESYAKDWKSLFVNYSSMTTREFAELNNQSFSDSKQQLEKLVSENKIERVQTKNGDLWKIKL